MANCTSVASDLSTRYLQTDRFHQDGSSVKKSLRRYLKSHGILLTMCYPSCILPVGTTHLATSYINNLIGVKVIETENYPIGLILDPSTVNINCLYPSNAASNGRDDNGCGPLSLDPKYGSQGASSYNYVTRLLVQREITKYKDLNFGSETPWTDIECIDFFGQSLPPMRQKLPHQAAFATSWHFQNNETSNNNENSNETKIFLQTIKLIKDYHDAIMNFEVCKITNSTPGFTNDYWLCYSGPKSWTPEQWQQVMDIQLQIQNNYPLVQNWNEIILSAPKEMQNIITAVFYIEIDTLSKDEVEEMKKQAFLEARLLGNKPVLKIETKNYNNHDDHHGDASLFKCVEPTTTTF